jgi:hypothetical protein
MKGRVGDRDGALIDIRLDTCADITLISEEFYKKIKDAPPIRQGIPVKLVQLMQEETGIEGFTTIPLYVASEEGPELEMEAEAYVVPGMSVPILLGEDFQLTYELALTRNVESGTKIHFQDWEFTVKAQNVTRTPDFNRILLSNKATTKLGRAQAHRNKLVKKRRQAAKFGEEKKIIRAAFDYKLRPHECRSILVEGYFQDDREWLVEKNLLANANDSHFIVPNTLISSTNPYIPISNPTNQPTSDDQKRGSCRTNHGSKRIL